jgi:hypothetical protein
MGSPFPLKTCFVTGFYSSIFKIMNRQISDEKLLFLRSLYESRNICPKDLTIIFDLKKQNLWPHLRYYSRQLIKPTIESLEKANIFCAIIKLGKILYKYEEIDSFIKENDFIPSFYISELFD